MLAPFSAQVGLGTVFESTYLRKSDFSRNITFSNGFWPKMTPRWGQDRPKIAPRWVQDRLGSPFFRLEFSLRFLIVWGSILGPSWGSFSVMLAPFSAKVGLGTVFEPTYLRKSDCSRNITFSNGFCSTLTPRWGQDRPKIAPRRVQDRLGSLLFHLDLLL